MNNRKTLIIKEYFIMINKLKELGIINIFPDFNNVTDIIFYFSYNFIMDCQHVPERIEDILEINNYKIESDEEFGKVCDIIINFLNLLNSL